MNLTVTWRKDAIDDHVAAKIIRTYEAVIHKLAFAELADDVAFGQLLP